MLGHGRLDVRSGLGGHRLVGSFFVMSIELSVVIPCLNEADTLESCIKKAWQGIRNAGVVGEVIVADNGSTDGSQEIATRNGARVVPVAAKGYGNALMGGIADARGQWVLMGDADDSYDFLEIPKFVEKLRQGYALVQGCRLPSGGGRVMPGAMPFLHRWWGNPMFTLMARWMFGAPINDVYCGMRAFTKAHYESLDLRCTGMEFATEMVIKSALFGAKIAEVPITLHKDGRRSHAPHLKTFRDGWRTLRFFLLYSPRWLFLIPGLVLLVAGACVMAAGGLGVRIGEATLEGHSMLYGAAGVLIGLQAVFFALAAKVFGQTEGLLPVDERVNRFFKFFTLERALVASLLASVLAVAMLVWPVWLWAKIGFGPMDYSQTLKVTVPGATLLVAAWQTALSSCFISLLGMGRR